MHWPAADCRRRRARLRIYVSEHAHSSVDKAALLAGFGRDNLRLVPFDAKYAMRADALAEMVAKDLANGDLPSAIVATVGTTATTAIDPIAPIAEVARRHGIWLHVDAAMAGSAMILPECRWMWEGVERADSLVINAHKWLGAPFDCSVYYVRDPEHLMRVMSTNPSFLQSSVDGQVKNLRDWGIPLGRRFRALKLWFIIREQGVSGLQRRLRRDMANARMARRAKSPQRPTGGWSRRSTCRPCAFATSRRRLTEGAGRRSAGSRTRPPGSRPSTAQARPISRRRSSTGAGWCGCPSAHCRPKRLTWPLSGPRCRRPRRTWLRGTWRRLAGRPSPSRAVSETGWSRSAATRSAI